VSPLRLPVDAELLTVNYLRARAELLAFVSTRVTTELPKEPTFPALTAFRLGGVADHPGWLDPASLQIDAWGTTKAQANFLARTALAALREMPDADHALGVVTHVAQNLGLTWAPDDITDQPRYVFGVAVHLHPHFQ
jgi:hypothetical protein